MVAVNSWLVSLVLASLSCLQVTAVCRWQAGEVGRCVPLEECVRPASVQEAAPLRKCRRVYWEGVCCMSAPNRTETFVFDNEKSVYHIDSDTETGISQRRSREVANGKGINTNDYIIFHKTNEDSKRNTVYRNARMRQDEIDLRNDNNKSWKQTENKDKIIYSNDSEDYLFFKLNEIEIANLKNNPKFNRKSRQLNSREEYEQTYENVGKSNTNKRRNEKKIISDHITYEDSNLHRNQDASRNTNSFREDNYQRNKETERRRTDKNRYTTERQSFTRSTKLRPIDDRPDVNISSEIDFSVSSTTHKSVTSKTDSSNSNGMNTRDEDSFVFESSDSRRGGSVPINAGHGNEPEVVMGPDDRDVKEEEEKRSFSVVKKMCERYSRSVTQQISATPLLPDPQTVTISVSKCHLDSNPLIVGGELARLNQFPHMAAVGWPAVQGDGYKWLCGGSLVSEEFVLTAAHCTYQDRDDTVRSGPPSVVHLGSNSLDGSEAQRIHIQRIYRHPGYRIPLSYHDLALLKLATPVVMSDAVRPACLGSAPRTGEKVVAAGWGLTGFGGATTRELRAVVLRMWDETGCRQAFGRTRRFPHGTHPSQVCAGHTQGGRDTCQGDSGGPLQVQSQSNQCIAYIVGVTSLGRACGLEQSPAVYTRVSRHIRFITQVVWPHL